MTQWKGDLLLPTIFPVFYVLTSSFLLPGQIENSTYYICGVNFFSHDIQLPHPIPHFIKRRQEDLKDLLPTEVQIVKISIAAIEALTYGALATQFCHHR